MIKVICPQCNAIVEIECYDEWANCDKCDLTWAWQIEDAVSNSQKLREKDRKEKVEFT
jgi:hypothetical protein